MSPRHARRPAGRPHSACPLGGGGSCIYADAQPAGPVGHLVKVPMDQLGGACPGAGGYLHLPGQFRLIRAKTAGDPSLDQAMRRREKTRAIPVGFWFTLTIRRRIVLVRQRLWRPPSPASTPLWNDGVMMRACDGASSSPYSWRQLFMYSARDSPLPAARTARARGRRLLHGLRQGLADAGNTVFALTGVHFKVRRQSLLGGAPLRGAHDH